ncbi:MAG: 4Fe-4S binding protein, partial [Candidatus Accumulibacter sp.]|nr:4Fe-4S binding protein [Accumulibacter sp.]
LSSSLVLGALPLTDPYVFVQMLAAGFVPAATAAAGALTLAAFYFVVGGRVFCAWVCPVNMATDAAGWLRRRFNFRAGHAPDSRARYWLLAGTLLAAALTGSLAWEWVNPVSVTQRGLIFAASTLPEGLSWAERAAFFLRGLGAAFGLGIWILAAVFFYDLLVAGRGWCGRLCPMGAFYGLLGRAALLRVAAPRRDACNDCMDCFAVCPEPQVIRPAVKKAGQESPVIQSALCTTCGRCIDVCSQRVFRLTHRFDQRSSS